jgi:hypothetical protein
VQWELRNYNIRSEISVSSNFIIFVWLQVSQGRTVRPISMSACQTLANMEVTVWMVLITTLASVAALGECLNSRFVLTSRLVVF